MDIADLEARLDLDVAITVEDLLSFVPTDSVLTLQRIHALLGNMRETGYAVLVSRHYEPQGEALEVLARHIPRVGRTLTIGPTFYAQSKIAREKRERNGIPHKADYLEAEVDMSSRYVGSQGKVGGTISPSTTNRPRGHQDIATWGDVAKDPGKYHIK